MRAQPRLHLRAVLAGAGVLLAVAACEQPKPQVTVFSGAVSDHRPPVCWSDDQTKVDLKACLSVSGPGAAERIDALGDSVGEVPVRADATIGVSVDAEVADRGWYVLLGSTRVNPQPVRDSYYRFSLPSTVVDPGNAVPMYVISLADDDVDTVTGVWAFQLVPQTGG